MRGALRPYLRARVRQHPGVNDGVRLFFCRGVHRRLREQPLWVSQRIIVDHLHEPLPVVAERGSNFNVPVRHGIDASGDAATSARGAFLDAATEAIGEDRGGAPVGAVDLRIEERNIDMLPDAMRLPRVDSAHRGDPGNRTGLQERGCTPELQWRPANQAVAEHLASHGEERRVRKGVVTVRAAVAKICDAQHGDIGHRPERFVVQPKPFFDRWCGTRNDEIRFSNQPSDDVVSSWLLEVEDHAFLVGVEELIRAAAFDAGLIMEKRPQRTRWVAAGALDLDNTRAEVREQLGGVRPRDVAREIQQS